MSATKEDEKNEHGVKDLVAGPDKMITPKAPREPVGPDDRLAGLRRHVNDSFCYHSAALADASFVKQEKKENYRIDIYTLIEERELKWKEKIYEGEGCSAESVALFQDSFDIPSTKTESKLKASVDLSRSFNKIQCPDCGGTGNKRCTACFGTGHGVVSGNNNVCLVCSGSGFVTCGRCKHVGSVLIYANLNITWYTIHSDLYLQNTELPERRFKSAGLREVFYDRDEGWAKENAFNTFAPSSNLKQLIEKSSAAKFWNDIEKQYLEKHLSKVTESMKMQRVQIYIEKLTILEVDYSLGSYVNERKNRKGLKNKHFAQFIQIYSFF